MGDHFLIILLVGIGLWSGVRPLLFVDRHIKVRADMTMRNVTMGIVCTAFLAVYLIRWGTGTMQLITAGVFAVVSALSMLTRGGLTETGVVVNGSVIPYDKITYYAFDAEQGRKVRLRIHTVRREPMLVIAADKAELAAAYFARAEVDSIDSYKARKRQG